MEVEEAIDMFIPGPPITFVHTAESKVASDRIPETIQEVIPVPDRTEKIPEIIAAGSPTQLPSEPDNLEIVDLT